MTSNDISHYLQYLQLYCQFAASLGFSSDGCDLLALPTEPSPLRMERGIWASSQQIYRFKEWGNTHWVNESDLNRGHPKTGFTTGLLPKRLWNCFY